MTNEECVQLISGTGILPLFYHNDGNVCVETMLALKVSGISVIEFTNRGKAARENFKKMVEANAQDSSPISLCVGTISNKEDATYFAEAGAAFLISPFYDEAVHAVCEAKNKIYIPGCMTPTEIHHAEKAGCNIIKLFPGNALSPGYLSGIVPLFPHCSFIVTGGVTTAKENLEAWFGAGAMAVGMGSNLVSKEVLEGRDFSSLKVSTSSVLTTIATFLKK